MSSPVDNFDLIVVGAGPGGSNAAAVALAGGLAVAQVEKHSFPRVKPCAGGLTRRSLASLQLHLEPSLRRSFPDFQFNLWDRGGSRFHHRSLLLHMVARPELDNDLVRQNLQHPRFSFFDGEPVRSLGYDTGFEVVTEKRRLRAPQLVGADGAYSLVNRRFGISSPRALATAVEVNLHRRRCRLEAPVPPSFDWGYLESGYGWVFPKDDHWSVGLYTLGRSLHGIRRRLADYVEAKGFRVDGDPLDTFEAYQLPVGGHRLRPPECPLYLVGDAGGFADAITGEGIYHALESGRLAGETAVRVRQGRAGHRSYYRRLWKTVLADTWLTYRFARLVYSNLGRSLRMLDHPLLWRPLVEGFARGATVSRSLLLAPWYWGLSFGRAGRAAAAGDPT